MENLFVLLVLIGVGGFFYFRKRDKSKRNISIGIALISFVLFGVTSPDVEEGYEAGRESAEEKTEKNQDDAEEETPEKESNDSEVDKKDESNEEDASDEKDKSDKRGESNEKDTDSENKEEIKREDEIKQIITDRAKNHSGYSNFEIEEIRVNEDMGDEDSERFIVLVDLLWTIKNKEDTADDFINDVSQDIAANLHNEGADDIKEIVVFTEDVYNDRDIKYTYEWQEQGFKEIDHITYP